MKNDEANFKNRLLPQAVALVTKATGGTGEPLIIKVLLETCYILENSLKSDAPIVAVERDVHTDIGTYHLFVRRLSSSIPPGKFQILISRELGSGLIY